MNFVSETVIDPAVERRPEMAVETADKEQASDGLTNGTIQVEVARPHPSPLPQERLRGCGPRPSSRSLPREFGHRQRKKCKFMHALAVLKLAFVGDCE
jgi:hypothetical protein